MPANPDALARIATLRGNQRRIGEFLARHPDGWYTPKQIARWLRLTERTARRHLYALVDMKVAERRQ